MNLKHGQAPVLFLLAACLASIGFVGSAGAKQSSQSSGSNSQPAQAGSKPGMAPQPLITDPLRHISGVVAVPPSQVLSSASSRGWAGPLTPPLFGPNIDSSLNNPSVQNETTIAINPENDQQLIASANDYRLALQPFVYLSTNGGTTWTNYQVPGTSSLSYGDPAMTFGTGGNAYFGYLGYTGLCTPSGGMYVSRSTNAGTTFSPPIQLAANSIVGNVSLFQDKEYVAVDNVPTSPYFGNVYEGWTNFQFQRGPTCGEASSQITAPIIMSRSTNQGLSWSTPITVSQPISDNNQGTVPVVGRHGEVYVYYVGAQTQTQPNYDTVLFSRSTDGGQTFPFFTHIASMVDLPNPLPHTNFRNNPFGAMAGDQQIDGYLYAVWSDYRTGDADILYSRSTDNGDTWAPIQRVNDDPSGNGKDQFFPWIATSPDGTVHVSWFDRREDPGDANYKEYYTYSTDHGATFEPNVAVSTAPSVPGTSAFIGDYSGIAATNGVVIPIWTDIRSAGNQNAYIARGVYTPTILTPTPTQTPTSTSTSTPTATNTPIVTATPTSTITTTPAPCSITFTDVHPEDYYYDPVTYLYCHGAISGYGDNTFRPYNLTTRGQLSKIVTLAEGWAIYTPPSPTFRDVDTSNAFYTYIETAYSHNIISGYSCGTGCLEFRPGNNVTRGQLTKIVVLAENWEITPPSTPTFRDVPLGDTFYGYIETAYSHNIISGYDCGSGCLEFRPGSNATRGQISKIVYLAITGP